MRRALVFTTIHPVNDVVRELIKGCDTHGISLIVAGDAKSPPDYDVSPGLYLDIAQQQQQGFGYTELCPTGVYARKNVAYLVAIQQGAEIIIETDDDNMPLETFWSARQRHQVAHQGSELGWLNIYRYYTDTYVWPRGFAMEAVKAPPPSLDELPQREVDCPIQNGLANVDPDVDAMYRLLYSLPLSFDTAPRRVAVSAGTWCPFNSQNTTTWKDAYPLLYLPAHCSWRMTDIWRSFVAQRVLWECGWSVLFHEPTVYQDRNEHDLMKDFREECIGYSWNGELCQRLETLSLEPGQGNISDNMRRCYQVLVDMKLCGPEELPLLDAWLTDLTGL